MADNKVWIVCRVGIICKEYSLLSSAPNFIDLFSFIWIMLQSNISATCYSTYIYQFLPLIFSFWNIEKLPRGSSHETILSLEMLVWLICLMSRLEPLWYEYLFHLSFRHEINTTNILWGVSSFHRSLKQLGLWAKNARIFLLKLIAILKLKISYRTVYAAWNIMFVVKMPANIYTHYM